MRNGATVMQLTGCELQNTVGIIRNIAAEKWREAKEQKKMISKICKNDLYSSSRFF